MIHDFGVQVFPRRLVSFRLGMSMQRNRISAAITHGILLQYKTRLQPANGRHTMSKRRMKMGRIALISTEYSLVNIDGISKKAHCLILDGQ